MAMPQSSKAQAALQQAVVEARLNSTEQVLAVHVLVALAKVERGVAQRALQLCGADISLIEEWVHQQVRSLAGVTTADAPAQSEEVASLLLHAEEIARRFGHLRLGTEHLLLAVLDTESPISPFTAIQACGCSTEQVQDAVYRVMSELGMLS